jgi:uncharacterized protein YjbI with pentapeptide repeats
VTKAQRSEQLDVLRLGVLPWNEWRKRNPSRIPALAGVRFDGGQTADRYAEGANLEGADFSSANLRKASFRHGRLARANFRGADLEGADFNHASLRDADFTGAKLSGANLADADLSGAILRDADLSETDLYAAVLVRTNLDNTKLDGALLGRTVFALTSLASVTGLELARYGGPSSIDIEMLSNDAAPLPEDFLRGVGVPEALISSLLRVDSVLFASCFISYSSRDRSLARRLYADIQAHGVRCWLAEKDLPIGAKTRTALDEAIRQHEKVLLLLSKNSVSSPWVEKEVETAFERERLGGDLVLLPIMLDDSAMRVDTGWAADLRRSRNIGDFRGWRVLSRYQSAVERLIDALKRSRTSA